MVNIFFPIVSVSSYRLLPMFYMPISMPFIGQFLLGPFCNEKTDVLDNYNIYISFSISLALVWCERQCKHAKWVSVADKGIYLHLDHCPRRGSQLNSQGACRPRIMFHGLCLTK